MASGSEENEFPPRTISLRSYPFSSSLKHMFLQATLNGLSRSCMCICMYVDTYKIKEEEVMNLRESRSDTGRVGRERGKCYKYILK